MPKSTWSEVEKGDVVELGGREWTVGAIKRKGKTAKVTVEHKGRAATSVVKLKDRVKIVRRRADVDPLHDREGAQRRWAERSELKRELGLPAGDPAQRKPPEKAKGAAWDIPVTGAEARITKTLGARLVAESKNEALGYYVPPVDVSTVAAHLALMHGGIGHELNEAAMLKMHAAQHAEAKTVGAALAVNHWHTEIRP